ncbi:MAG: hypothetical protein WD317_09305 [Balneolaceae bacterium]
MEKAPMSMTLYDIIISSAGSASALQKPDGSMPPGVNGPYNDPETPVRNTAHWTMVFLKAHDISGERRFLKSAEQALGYLHSTAARPMGHTFWHRKNPDKDTCNGLIGQAWTLEALVLAGEQTGREESLRLAEEVFLLHPFDEEKGLWQRVNADGMRLPFDVTFNHQLWFAAAGALLGRHSETAARQAGRFMEMLPVHLRLYGDGLIYHPLLFRFGWRQTLKDLLRAASEPRERKEKLRYKAVGYHLFNMHAFCMLHEVWPGHSFWEHRLFKQALSYAFSDEFSRQIGHNTFGYPYNPPGFEMGYVIDRFGGRSDGGRSDGDRPAGARVEGGSVEGGSVDGSAGDGSADGGRADGGDRVKKEPDKSRWVSSQLERCYNPATGLMDRGTPDGSTHAARLYEAVRLNNVGVEFREDVPPQPTATAS